MSLASSLLTQARAWGFLAGVATSGAAYVAAKVSGERGWGARDGVCVPLRPAPSNAALSFPHTHTQRDLWTSTAWLADRLPNPPPPPPPPSEPEPLIGPDARARAARAWNEGVDAVFGPAVRELSRRGW